MEMRNHKQSEDKMKKKSKWIVEATMETVEGVTLRVCFEDRNDSYTFADYSLGSLAIEKGLNPIAGTLKTKHKKVAANVHIDLG